MTPPAGRRTEARHDLVHDVNNYVTAEAGFRYLLADGLDTPEQAAENRAMLARATAERRRVVEEALAAGTISPEEAVALGSEDVATVSEAVAGLRSR